MDRPERLRDRPATSGLRLSPARTLLLRAALLSGEPAHDGWRRWERSAGNVRHALAGEDRLWVKRLLPLLLASVHRNRLPCGGATVTLLKMAYAGEAARHAACRRIAGAILRELETRRRAAVAVRGLALSETVYDDPSWRHCHDIDVLLAADGLAEASDLLRRRGWQEQGHSNDGSVRLVHDSGMPLVLHRWFHGQSSDPRLSEEMLERCREATIAGVPVSVPAPADSLVLACTHASQAGVRSPLALCDAWFLLPRLREADWRLVADVAARAAAAKAVQDVGRYLSSELDAPVPSALAAGNSANACPF